MTEIEPIPSEKEISVEVTKKNQSSGNVEQAMRYDD